MSLYKSYVIFFFNSKTNLPLQHYFTPFSFNLLLLYMVYKIFVSFLVNLQVFCDFSKFLFFL